MNSYNFINHMYMHVNSKYQVYFESASEYLGLVLGYSELYGKLVLEYSWLVPEYSVVPEYEGNMLSGGHEIW